MAAQLATQLAKLEKLQRLERLERRCHTCSAQVQIGWPQGDQSAAAADSHRDTKRSSFSRRSDRFRSRSRPTRKSIFFASFLPSFLFVCLSVCPLGASKVTRERLVGGLKQWPSLEGFKARDEVDEEDDDDDIARMQMAAARHDASISRRRIKTALALSSS